jgi:ABC-type uncharacterized transport system substrate-binding protein
MSPGPREVAAGKVPIVMAPVSDPIAAGFVDSLSWPGGNLTGLSMFGPNLAAKRMEFLKELRPDMRTVAFLGSRADVNAATFIRGTQAEGIAYGPNHADIFRRSAAVVDKILTGERPGDIPVQQPVPFSLRVNLKTAAALGLTVPAMVLARADEVIE